MLTEICYLDLAKECKSRGDMKGVWRAFRQHARVMRKKRSLPVTWKTDEITDNDILPQQAVKNYAG